MAKDRYKRATDLFEVGEVLQPDPDGPLYYALKLNTFQQDEVRLDASVVRSRTVMVMNQQGSDEVNALRDAVTRLPKERLVRGIVNGKYTTFVSEASNEIHADPEWRERLDVLERSRNLAVLEPDERQIVVKINADYLDYLQELIKLKEDQDTRSLQGMDDEEIRKEYIANFIDSRGTAIFLREMKYGEVLFGIRTCEATKADDGEWDHVKCDHDPVYDTIEEVRSLPDPLMDTFTRAFDRLNVPGRQAKGSASRQASSAPSRPQSEEAASVPSTQAVTSPVPVGTSA